MLTFCRFFVLSLAFSSIASAASALDNYYLDAYSTFSGPTLGSISNQSTNDNGVQSTATPIDFDTEITAAYLLDKKSMIGIGPDIRFYYNPSNLSPKSFTNNDWGIKAFDKKTIDANGLRVATSLLFQVPTSDGSRNRNMNWALKATPYFWYVLGNSAFKVGSWTEEKFYSGVTSGKDWKLYAEPYISYDVSDRFSWILGYEFEYSHFVSGSNGFVAVERDIEPGFGWNITKEFYLNPYLLIFPFDTISWRTTGVAVFFGMRIL